MESQPRAPSVHYEEIGPAYERARLANTILAGGAVMWIGFLLGWQAFAVGAALVVGALILNQTGKGGEYTRRRVTMTILADSFAISATLFITGMWEALLLTGSAYVMTSAVLLLPRRIAAAVIVTFAAWTAAGIGFSPVLLPEVAASRPVSLLIAGLFLAATLVIVGLSSAALHKVRDVERKLLASERRANALKDQFVSMVSHELRTPLTSIAGFAETLQDGWPDLEEPEINEFLAIITDQSNHLRNVVEDILIIPRLEAGRLNIKPEIFDLSPLAHRLVQIIFPEGGPTEAHVSLSGGPEVYADPKRVEQILRNLLENARKYGGDEVAVHNRIEEDRYIVIVTDNGTGVPEEDRERIFDHFEQVSGAQNSLEGGIGLGLPIARRLAREMGGDLWFEAAFPAGSHFQFSLPLAVAREQSRERQLKKSA